MAVRVSLVVVAAFLTVSGCGQKKDFGENIKLDLLPGNTIVGPGPNFSCSDMQMSASTRSRSVAGPVISFNNFALEWTGRDQLFVSIIKATIRGVGIHNGEQTIALSSDEIVALLGRGNSIIDGSSTATGTVVIQSKDPYRSGTTSIYTTPCALSLGPLQLVNGTKTQSFKAQVTLEIIGMGRTSSGEEYLVKDSTTASADFYPY